MQILGITFLMIGGVVALVACIWWIAECFTTSPFWGYGALFTFPIGNLIWLVFYPRRGWKPVATLLAGAAVLGLGWLCFGHMVAAHPALASAGTKPQGSPTPITKLPVTKLLFPQY